MSICETVKTQKWYYLHNSRSAYFPIDRRLHRERETHTEGGRERERGRGGRERLCPSMRERENRERVLSE